MVADDEKGSEVMHGTRFYQFFLCGYVKRGALLLVLGLLASGCTDESVFIGGPLMLSLTAASSVAVTDSLVVEYTVVGRSLLGMVVDYGDMQIDSFFFSSAQTASGRAPHLYAAPGQYSVSARVEDSVEGNVTEGLTVTVTP